MCNNTQVFISSFGDDWPNLVRAVGCDNSIRTKMAIFGILDSFRRDSYLTTKFVKQVLDKLYPQNPFIAIVMLYYVCGGRKAPMNHMERQFYHGLLDSEEFQAFLDSDQDATQETADAFLQHVAPGEEPPRKSHKTAKKAPTAQPKTATVTHLNQRAQIAAERRKSEKVCCLQGQRGSEHHAKRSIGPRFVKG